MWWINTWFTNHLNFALYCWDFQFTLWLVRNVVLQMFMSDAFLCFRLSILVVYVWSSAQSFSRYHPSKGYWWEFKESSATGNAFHSVIYWFKKIIFVSVKGIAWKGIPWSYFETFKSMLQKSWKSPNPGCEVRITAYECFRFKLTLESRKHRCRSNSGQQAVPDVGGCNRELVITGSRACGAWN